MRFDLKKISKVQDSKFDLSLLVLAILKLIIINFVTKIIEKTSNNKYLHQFEVQ